VAKVFLIHVYCISIMYLYPKLKDNRVVQEFYCTLRLYKVQLLYHGSRIPENDPYYSDNAVE